jgi:hypothetical protein
MLEPLRIGAFPEGLARALAAFASTMLFTCCSG